MYNFSVYYLVANRKAHTFNKPIRELFPKRYGMRTCQEVNPPFYSKLKCDHWKDQVRKRKEKSRSNEQICKFSNFRYNRVKGFSPLLTPEQNIFG